MAYETGKGKPKMTAQDKDNRIYHAREKLDDSYRPYLDGENVSAAINPTGMVNMSSMVKI